MDLISVFQETWAIRALIASGLVGIMCGALGAFIVLRNMSMIGDALSHAILPGVVFAFVVVGGYSSFGFFIGAVIAGLISAFGITWIQQNIQTKNDAAIGIVFTAMFSIGVIGISWISRNEGVHLDLKDFLFGNVLTVSDQDLLLTACVASFVLLSVVVFYRYLFISTFQPVIASTMGFSVKAIHYFLMLLLSFAVVASLQTVGVILVVAMLITPASTALLLSDRLERVVAISAVLGLLAAVFGLIASIVFETTPGPAMAVVTTLIYLMTSLVAPKKGVIAKFLTRKGQQRKVELEDTLKEAFKQQGQGEYALANVSERLGYPHRKTRRLASTLAQRKLLSLQKDEFKLTDEGVKKANSLIRAHRLWETYLVNQVGLEAQQIHEDAERLEHLLSEELLDEVDQELGYPTTDPHGSPIPRKVNGIQFPLNRLDINESATISEMQPVDRAARILWEHGLEANAVIQITSTAPDHIIMTSGDQLIRLSMKDARIINVDPVVHSSSEPI